MLTLSEQEKLMVEYIRILDKTGVEQTVKNDIICQICDALSDNDLIYKCKVVKFERLSVSEYYLIGSGITNFFFIPV